MDARRTVIAVMAQIRAEAAIASMPISDLARKAGVSRSSLDLYLKGERQMPIDVLYKISEVLGIEPVTIMGRAQQRLQEEGPDVLHEPAHEPTWMDLHPDEITGASPPPKRNPNVVVKVVRGHFDPRANRQNQIEHPQEPAHDQCL